MYDDTLITMPVVNTYRVKVESAYSFAVYVEVQAVDAAAAMELAYAGFDNNFGARGCTFSVTEVAA